MAISTDAMAQILANTRKLMTGEAQGTILQTILLKYLKNISLFNLQQIVLQNYQKQF